MTRVQRVPSFFGIGCPHTSVPQSTVQCFAAAPLLGPLGLRCNGPSNSARRRAARPHQLSSLWTSRVSARQGWVGEKVPEPRHKSYTGIPCPQLSDQRYPPSH